jgi:hypothetical protein
MHECHSISAASLTDPCSKLAASQAEVILPYWSCMLSWPESMLDAALVQVRCSPPSVPAYYAF